MITERFEISDKDELKLLMTEFENLKKSRFWVIFEKNIVVLYAKDKTALKAIKNSVLQTRNIYKKMKSIK